MAKEMKPLLVAPATLLAEIGPEPIGFVIAVPDINVALRHINGRLTWLGLPIGLTMMFEATLFFSSNFFMGHFGLDYLAAHSVAMNIPSVTFMVPLGIAMASTVRVGLAAGAARRADQRP